MRFEELKRCDPSFNAITGLNSSVISPSGSNNNASLLQHPSSYYGVLSQVSAQDQRNLIDIRGQADITKASNTSAFDNSDRGNSPLGLENYV